MTYSFVMSWKSPFLLDAAWWFARAYKITNHGGEHSCCKFIGFTDPENPLRNPGWEPPLYRWCNILCDWIIMTLFVIPHDHWNELTDSIVSGYGFTKCLYDPMSLSCIYTWDSSPGMWMLQQLWTFRDYIIMDNGHGRLYIIHATKAISNKRECRNKDANS